MSRLARQLFSDVIGIGYIEGEIKATECEVIVPDNIPFETVETLPNDSELLQSYLGNFEKEEQFLALEYLKTVMKHFDWSQSRAIQEMTIDKDNLIQKFNAWKSKIKKTEEV